MGEDGAALANDAALRLVLTAAKVMAPLLP